MWRLWILASTLGCTSVYLREKNLTEPGGIVAVSAPFTGPSDEPSDTNYSEADKIMSANCKQMGFEKFKIASANYEPTHSGNYLVLPCIGLCIVHTFGNEYRIHFRCEKSKNN